MVDSLTTDINLLLNPNAYQKGAWILHMLRQEMGDTAFFLGLKDFYATYKFRNANTLDFFRSMQPYSHKNLDNFISQWVYQEGHPILHEDSRNRSELVLSQLQKELFSFPLKIKFKDSYGHTELVDVEVNTRVVKINVPDKLQGKSWEYILDPQVRLLFEAD